MAMTMIREVPWRKFSTWPAEGKIDWKAVMAGQTVHQRKSYALAEMQRLGDKLSLTDVLLNLSRGGLQMMELLSAEEQGQLRRADGRRLVGSTRTFRIRVLRRPDGSPVAPGEEIAWKVAPVTHDDQGRPLTTKAKRSMARRGEPLELSNVAIVDQDGCVTVGFSDASYLLNRNGAETAPYRERGRGEEGRYNWLYVEEPRWVSDSMGQQDSGGDPETKRRGRPRLDSGAAN